jgi:hypothetical protein
MEKKLSCIFAAEVTPLLNVVDNAVVETFETICI